MASSLSYQAKTSTVWAATTKDPDYIRTEGLKKTISTTAHRKEIVAGGLWNYMLTGRTLTTSSCPLLTRTAAYAQGIKRLGTRAGDFFDLQSELRTRDHLNLFTLLAEPLKELPQVNSSGCP